MKRIKFTLRFLGGCLLVLVIVLLFTCWGHRRAIDYRIDDIIVEKVILGDSVCHGHQHYLVRLMVSPVHYKYGFWEGSVPALTEGCVDSIWDMTIESETHQRLDDHILNAELIDDSMTKELCQYTDSIHGAMSSHNSLRRVKERLQEDSPYNILISVDSFSLQPKYLIIRFRDRKIRKRVPACRCRTLHSTRIMMRIVCISQESFLTLQRSINIIRFLFNQQVI